MKLQLTPDALRLRLSEAEVQEFAQAGQLTHTLAFGPGPGQALRYALRRLPATDPASALRAHYASGALVVEVPAALAHSWATTANIALKGVVLMAENQELRILVEKDLGPSH
ncbi:MAG: DUF7009 family protein [Janthinobacterium lividum]